MDVSALWVPVMAAVFGGAPSRPVAAESDALRYIALRIQVNLAARRIDGVVHLAIDHLASTGALVLDISDSMTVDSARAMPPRGGSTIAGIRTPGHISFAGPSSAATGRFDLTVWYHGQPARRAVDFGTAPGSVRVASFGLPLSARQWWPTIDRPSAKADSADIWITAPAALVAVSGGAEVARRPDADGNTATTHWTIRHPVYSDVISFAVGDYAITKSTVILAPGRHVALQYYVFPEDSAKASADFASVPAILRFLDARLGPYPFGNEKYALVEFARPSFREAQTLTHLGARFLTGRRDAEQVIAHEIAHQWFGNSLSVGSWADIWLNESLAEYMAWQWMRVSHGDSVYRALVTEAAAVAPVRIVPADTADFNSLFGTPTFERGPAVLVMLEQEIGPRPFAAALRSYTSRHRYGTVTTADFQLACEVASGRKLGVFFGQWIRGDAPLPRH